MTLQKKGIETLGTAVFGAHQAIAASQAGMYAISPYFNGAFVSSHAQADQQPLWHSKMWHTGLM